MISLNEENSDFTKGSKINLVFNPFKITKTEIEKISVELFEKYKDVIYSSSVALTQKHVYKKREDGGWMLTPYTRNKSLKKKPLKQRVAWMPFEMVMCFKFPDREMTIHELGIENKKAYLNRTTKLIGNKPTNYFQLKDDVLPFLIENDLVEIYDNQNKPFNKVYCFTNKYFKEINRYFRFRYMERDLEKLYQLYQKNDMSHLLLTDYNELLTKLNSPNETMRRHKEVLRVRAYEAKKKLGLT